MTKMLIIDTCLVNHNDDRGGVAHARGEIIDPPKDEAKKLVLADRALYVAKADDFDKNGRYTASKELVAAAQKAKAEA